MKYVKLIFSMMLFTGLLIGFIQSGNVQASTLEPSLAKATDDKIEILLFDEFTAEGTADFIVKFAQQADLSPANQMNWEDRGWFVYNTLTETAQKSQVNSIAILGKYDIRYQTFIAGNELYVWGGNLTIAQSLADLPEVGFIRAKRTYYIDPIKATDNPVLNSTWAGDLLANEASFNLSPEATTDWGIIDTKADLFWAQFGYEGEGIVVANIDTGVQYTHPALYANYKCGAGPHTDCWLDPDGTLAVPTDGNGHGTHTMGTMAADNDPGLTYIAGMAPDAQWIACQGCDTSSCDDADLNACADWILAPNGNPANRPNIVNNSWGGPGGDNWYQAKVQAWQAAGIFPAFSAGNSTGCSSLGSPGDYQESFGTTGHNSSRAHVYAQGPSATFGHDPYTKPNISAPASSVCSSVPTNSWSCSYSGTSMASPHSAGAVALLWSCNPSLVGNIAATFEALQSTADAPNPANPACGVPPDGEGTYEDGYGYLNVLEAGIYNCVASWGGLDGHVTDALSTAVIEDVTVTGFRDVGGQWSDDTDVTGYYSMTVGTGTYTVTAEHPLYTTGIVTGIQIITDTVTTQNFALQPKGRLFGYVTDQDSGAPLVGTVSVPGGPMDDTDPATGYYELYLDAGTYSVTAQVPDYADETVPITLTVGEQEQHDFALLAAIAVVPDPIEITLGLGQTGNVGSQMTNNMAVTYPFEFIEIEGGAGTQASGGPDPFGYTFADSNEAGGPRYEWVDATDGTGLGLTDDSEANVTLPFAFSFYGTPSTAIRVGNNGGFFFNATTGDLSTTNANLGTTTTNNLVVPFWDDIDADTGNVYYKTVGTAPNRMFVVEWFNRPHFSNIGNATFELILYEGTNNIKYQYQDVVFGNALYDYGVSATVGIRQTGSNYLQYSYNQAVIQDGLAICFTYPGSPPCDGGDVTWFGTSIVTGTVPAGNTLGWTNVFSATTGAGIGQPGVYNARLRIIPTTTGLPSKTVDVIMTVLPTATFGKLNGTVTSDRPGGPLEADILIEATGGVTVALTTDPATGFYSYWLGAGTYDVTASAGGYVTETAQVQITGLMTTTQDFELALDAPEIVITPASLVETLELGQTGVQTLTIHNDGLHPLDFEIRERPVNNAAQVNTILLMVEDVLAADWNAYRTALANAGFTWDEWDLETLPFPTAAELAPYETLIWADESSMTPGDAPCQIVADWLVSGGKSLFVTSVDFLWDLQNGTPGAGEHNLYLLFNTTYVGDYAGTGITRLNGVAGDPIGGDFVEPNGLILSATADSNGDYSSTSSVATTSLIYGPGGTGSGNSGLSWYEGDNYKTVWLGVNFHNGLTDAAQRDMLMANIMGLLVGGDVPWLAEEPITGTVGVGSTIDISVSFDAGAVPAPGEYLAELRVMSNDPLNSPVDVPVTLNVLPTPNLGKLQGTITGLGYCDEDSYPLEANVLIEASTGISWTVESDPSGFYYRWLYADTYTVTASAPEHLDAMGVVEITGLVTSTLDLALPYIESCLTITPTNLSVTMTLDSQQTELLTIGNDGAGELIWEVHETTQTVRVAIPAPAQPLTAMPAVPVERPVITSPDQCAQYENYTAVEPIGAAEFCGTPALATLPSGGVMAPTDPGFAVEMYNTSTLVTFPLNNFTGQTTVGSITAPYYGIDFDPSAEVLYALNDTTDQLGTFDLTTGVFTGLVPCAPGGGATNWTGLSIDPTTGVFYGSTATNLYIIDPATGNSTLVGAFGTTLMIDIAVNTDGQMYGHDIGTDSIYSINPATGMATLIGPTGYLANYAQGMDFDNTDGTLYIFLYQSGGANVYGTVNLATGDVTPLAVNAPMGEFEGATKTAGAPPWIDVPWVSEVPTNGVVGPESTFDVSVTFVSTDLTAGECYTASLGLIHDDPGWDSPSYIPLSLCVVPEYSVDLEPESSLGSGLPGEVITYTLRMTNTGDLPDTFVLSYGEVDPGWIVELPVTSFELEAGEGVDVALSVTIPGNAGSGDFDTFTLTAASLMASDDVEVTTTAGQLYGVDLEPETSDGIGSPGDVINYTLLMTNKGNGTDTFLLSSSNVDPDWTVELPITSVELTAGEAVEVVVSVTIPADAGDGDFDTFTLIGTSTLVFDEVEITTTAEILVYRFWLPLIVNN